jgi:hypothetical protein
MSYTLQEQYSSKNQVPGPQADSVWHRGARKVSSITIHHWGNKGQKFGTVRDFLCTNNSPTSAHYVVQDGLVACIVSPDDCAFHAGNAEGNSHSIGIECRPEATDGDYATVAELIRNLRAIYGDIPLRPHNYWYNTACPGDYDLARLDSLARGGTINTQSSTVTPLEEGFLMALSDDEQRRILAAADRINGVVTDPRAEVLTTNHIDAVATSAASKVLNTPVARGGDGAGLGAETNLGAIVGWFDSAVLGLAAAINSQAAAAGATPEQVIDAVKQALATGVVKVDVSVDGGK